jgi:hypothetical protein
MASRDGAMSRADVAGESGGPSGTPTDLPSGGASRALPRLDQGGARLLVRRLDGDVVMRALDQAEHAFRAALLRGRPLEHAATAAREVEPAFDLTTALHELFEERIAVDVAVSNGQEVRHDH